MENRKSIQLKEAIEVAGQSITEVEVRRPTVGDEEDAMETAIQMKKNRNPLSVEICLASRLTGIPYDKIRRMSGPDYAAIRSAINSMNGVKAPIMDDENPTMPNAN